MADESLRKEPADALATLGTIITAEQKRDAIHVAVIPLQAAHKLYPGQAVGVENGKASAGSRKLLGIVDPFLGVDVEQDQWFWMLLFPRTITSLRHVWSHPELPDELQPESGVRTAAERRATSEAWLREFVARSDCPGYETLVATALDHARGGNWSDEYLHFGGQDAHGDIPPEFWDHIENVTGQRIEEQRRARYFSCAC